LWMDFLKWELMLVGILQRKVIMDILPLWDRVLVVISPKSSIPKKRRELLSAVYFSHKFFTALKLSLG